MTCIAGIELTLLRFDDIDDRFFWKHSQLRVHPDSSVTQAHSLELHNVFCQKINERARWL